MEEAGREEELLLEAVLVGALVVDFVVGLVSPWFSLFRFLVIIPQYSPHNFLFSPCVSSDSLLAHRDKNILHFFAKRKTLLKIQTGHHDAVLEEKID